MPLRGETSTLSALSHIDTYRSTHADAVGFIQLSEQLRLPPPAPRFMFGPVPQHLGWQLFGEFTLSAVGCYIIRDGRLTSDAIALHGETALWSHALNHPDYYVRNVVSQEGLKRGDLPIRRLPGRVAVIFGPGYPVYGHWLVDFLPRFYVLQKTGFDLQSLTFVLPRDLPPFGFEFMRLMGIPEDHVLRHAHDDEQLLCDELLLPTTLRTASRLHPIFAAASHAWVERIAGRAPAGANKRKLLISRAGVRPGRVLRNREAVEAMAIAAGYETVQPETLPLREQIDLFRSARHVIGEYGSGLHGTILGSPGLSAMVLRGTSVAPGFVQSGLAAAAWQSIGYVFGESDAHAVDYAFDVDERDFQLGLACLDMMP